MQLLVVRKWFPFSVSLCLTSEMYIEWSAAHKKVTTEQFAEPKSLKEMASSVDSVAEKPWCACFPPQTSWWQWAAVITKTPLYLPLSVSSVAFSEEKKEVWLSQTDAEANHSALLVPCLNKSSVYDCILQVWILISYRSNQDIWRARCGPRAVKYPDRLYHGAQHVDDSNFTLIPDSKILWGVILWGESISHEEICQQCKVFYWITAVLFTDKLYLSKCLFWPTVDETEG